MKPVLIIKAGCSVKSIPEEAGDFEDWIMQGMGLPVEMVVVVDVFAGKSLPQLQHISALVISGSPSMVTDREPWSEYTAAYLKKAVDKKIPALGICYGHQLLTYALGGKVGLHPAGREIGTTEVYLSSQATDDPLLVGIPYKLPVHVSHRQSVLELPQESTILGSNDFEAYHVVRFRDQAWGVQFHPEFDAGIMRAYINERSDDLKQEGMDVDGLLDQVRETPESKKLLRNFAHIIQARQAV